MAVKCYVNHLVASSMEQAAEVGSRLTLPPAAEQIVCGTGGAQPCSGPLGCFILQLLSFLRGDGSLGACNPLVEHLERGRAAGELHLHWRQGEPDLLPLHPHFVCTEPTQVHVGDGGVGKGVDADAVTWAEEVVDVVGRLAEGADTLDRGAAATDDEALRQLHLRQFEVLNRADLAEDHLLVRGTLSASGKEEEKEEKREPTFFHHHQGQEASL